MSGSASEGDGLNRPSTLFLDGLCLLDSPSAAATPDLDLNKTKTDRQLFPPAWVETLSCDRIWCACTQMAPDDGIPRQGSACAVCYVLCVSLVLLSMCCVPWHIACRQKRRLHMNPSCWATPSHAPPSSPHLSSLRRLGYIPIHLSCPQLIVTSMKMGIADPECATCDGGRAATAVSPPRGWTWPGPRSSKLGPVQILSTWPIEHREQGEMRLASQNRNSHLSVSDIVVDTFFSVRPCCSPVTSYQAASGDGEIRHAHTGVQCQALGGQLVRLSSHQR